MGKKRKVCNLGCKVGHLAQDIVESKYYLIAGTIISAVIMYYLVFVLGYTLPTAWSNPPTVP